MLIALAYPSYQFYDAIAWFRIEGAIHHAFFPVVMAIDAYVRDEKVPPAQLSDLVPQYIAEIPTSKYSGAPSYRVLQEKNWEFFVDSDERGVARKYLSRSTGYYTKEEERHIILKYHGVWVVLQ